MTPITFFKSCFSIEGNLSLTLIFREREEGRERGRERRRRERRREIEIYLLSHPLMHSLITSCMCPDRGSNPQTLAYWRQYPNQLSNPDRAYDSNICLHGHIATYPISLCFTLTRIPIVGFRVHQDNPGWTPHLSILNLIVSTKTIFPNKVTFTSLRAYDVNISFFEWYGALCPLHPVLPTECYTF